MTIVEKLIDKVRVWWFIVGLAIAGLGVFGGAMAVGGGHGARLTVLEADVRSLKRTAKQVDRIDGMLSVLFERETGKNPDIVFPVPEEE